MCRFWCILTGLVMWIVLGTSRWPRVFGWRGCTQKFIIGFAQLAHRWSWPSRGPRWPDICFPDTLFPGRLPHPWKTADILFKIKSNQIYFAQNTSHLNAASGNSSWWAWSTRLKRALTVTLKRQVKQILSTNNGIAFKHKLLKTT